MIFILFILFSAAGLAQDSIYTLSPVEVTDVRTGLNNFQQYILIDEVRDTAWRDVGLSSG
jgi:hypothetical protein